jgi:hypothetical protein
MIVRTKDGEEFVGNSAAEIVSQMRLSDWNAPARKRDYMLDVIERVEDMTGVFVDQELVPTTGTDEHIDPRHFLSYLESVKLITVEDLPTVG